MVRPLWEGERPGDRNRIARNARSLIRDLAADAHDWSMPAGEDDVLHWHRRLYTGCRVPHAGYVGHFRGDPAVPDLVGYEVGMGRRRLADGFPEKVGVWSAELGAAIPSLIAGIQAGLRTLDAALEPGERPVTNDVVDAVVLLAARTHGEWIRLHPFANGNGGTARVWANYIALRYSFPPFVWVKPRPLESAYVRAGHASMGRPPEFAGDHGPIAAVFARMLHDSLDM